MVFLYTSVIFFSAKLKSERENASGYTPEPKSAAHFRLKTQYEDDSDNRLKITKEGTLIIKSH